MVDLRSIILSDTLAKGCSWCPRLFLDGRIDDAIKLLDEDELRRTAQEGERQIADAVQT